MGPGIEYDDEEFGHGDHADNLAEQLPDDDVLDNGNEPRPGVGFSGP